MTLAELANELRERSAALRCWAEGPSWFVAMAVPPLIAEVKVENPDLELAICAAFRVIDRKLAARAAAAEGTAS